MKVDVQHDPAQRRFFATVDREEAFLEYSVIDATTLDFHRTFTPPKIRGRGVAKEIVRHALRYARGRGFDVVPSCWYVQLVLDRERKEKSA